MLPDAHDRQHPGLAWVRNQQSRDEHIFTRRDAVALDELCRGTVADRIIEVVEGVHVQREREHRHVRRFVTHPHPRRYLKVHRACVAHVDP